MRNAGTACPILMCDTWKLARVLCRFKIYIQMYHFPNSKKVHFLPYANLSKLGSGTAIFYYAEPPKE